MSNAAKVSSNFEWIRDTSQFNEDFIKNSNEESDERYFLEVDLQYLEKWLDFHDDLPSLPEMMKIEKVENLVANLHDKTEYVLCITNLKQALNHELVLKKICKVINFNPTVRLKLYIHMNKDLRKKAKKWWIMDTLMSWSYFWKNYQKCEKTRRY